MGDTSSNIQVNVGKIETEVDAIGNLNLGDQVAGALSRIKAACDDIKASVAGEHSGMASGEPGEAD